MFRVRCAISAVAGQRHVLGLLLMVLVPTPPVFVKDAYRRAALMEAYAPSVRNGIGSLEAHHGIEVPSVRRRNYLLHQLDEVGSRGRLGHP